MALRGLAPFFDFEQFAKDKELAVKDTRPLRDSTTGLVIGTRVEVLIWQDNTKYAPGRDGSIPTNRYNSFVVKVHKKDLDLEVDDIVEFKDVVAKIYGEYNNELTVDAEDVVVIRKGLMPVDNSSEQSGKDKRPTDQSVNKSGAK